MLRSRIRKRSRLLSPHQGGILLMMRLAPPLALLATRSWREAETDSTRLDHCHAFSLDVRDGGNGISLVSGLRGMAQQYNLFTDLLRTIDYMKAFASQRKNSEDQLRLRMEEAEASLSTAREDNEALRADWLRQRAGRSHEAEGGFAAAPSSAKKELEGEFAADREALEADYQKQVDDMFSSAIAAV
ncbi:hypothetical protein CK203_081556 [Vitis vinifera]|uniref:Uncharacterized protein n=1 Tax=Vitis vinifera TaxID=29760 RepID=A0A438E2I5_VITVI|nr:hypothetical protein CK203_081556 [Vitis vinifera]